MGSKIIAEIERDYIYDLVRRGKREDGRGLDDFRDIDIKTDYVGKAEGSAKVKLGKTEVVVGVKIEPGDPFPDTPGKGVLISNAELNAMASPNFEPGPPGEEATEIARVVDRGLRESGAINFEKLCIKEGEDVWMVFVDIHVLNQGGNLIDVSTIGAVSALLTASIPHDDYDVEEGTLEVDTIPVSCTSLKCSDEILVDPTYIEEEVGSTRLTVITNSEDEIVGIQKGLSGTWTQDEIMEVVDKSIRESKEIRKLINSSI